MDQHLSHLEGTYEILGKLSEGGMGEIFRVRHRLLEEDRVVKLIRPHLAANREASARFVREARLAIKLRHRNIAQLLDFAVDDTGTAYIVMEYIPGVTLLELRHALGRLPLELVLEVADQALVALAFLHRKGVIHRDISPDNLMLTRTEDGRPLVKLIDLGLARSLQESTAVTIEGTYLGKIRYSSPEQLEGSGVATTGPGADLYSLSVVLYELLVGRLPVRDTSASLIIAGHLHLPPIEFSETDPEGKVPVALRRAVMRGLEKKAVDRYLSAVEYQQVLAPLHESCHLADGALSRAFDGVGNTLSGMGPHVSATEGVDVRRVVSADGPASDGDTPRAVALTPLVHERPAGRSAGLSDDGVPAACVIVAKHGRLPTPRPAGPHDDRAVVSARALPPRHEEALFLWESEAVERRRRERRHTLSVLLAVTAVGLVALGIYLLHHEMIPLRRLVGSLPPGVVDVREVTHPGDLRLGPGETYARDARGPLKRGQLVYVTEQKGDWLRGRVSVVSDPAETWFPSDWTKPAAPRYRAQLECESRWSSADGEMRLELKIHNRGDLTARGITVRVEVSDELDGRLFRREFELVGLVVRPGMTADLTRTVRYPYRDHGLRVRLDTSWRSSLTGSGG